MASTQITGRQIADGSIERSDINISAAGKALIRKIIVTPSTGITISSYTGADPGTGDVTLAIDTNTIATTAWVQAQGYITSNDGYISNVALHGNDLQFTGIGNAFSGNVDLSSLIPTEVDTLATVVARGSTTTNSISVVESTGGGYLFRTSNGWGGWARHGFSFANGSGTVMKSLGAYGGSGTSLSYMYLGTDYQTNTLRIYNDYVYVPGLDLAMSNSNNSHGAGTYFRGDGGHFVLGLNNGNTLYLNYGNGSGILRTYGAWYHHDVQILSTSRVLTNVSGNISMFTNDSAYITAAALAGYATQTYVNTQIANLVDSAPSTLDTLNELAAALGDDPNFATTVTNSIATKVPQSRTLTINGVSYDLSANRSWTISTADGYIQDVQLEGNELRFAGVGSAFTGNIDLAQLGYLTSFTETDPTVPAHVKSITTTEKSNWNTAYGWGNHASAGYLTSYTETDPVYVSERDSLQLNKTVHPTLLFSTLADYNKPSGYSTMIQPSSYQNPLPSHGYYHIIARRDTSGGYGALLQSYNSHELYHGNTLQSTTNISWYKIWNSGDFTSTNISNWNTAYSWGNHASAGYLTVNSTVSGWIAFQSSTQGTPIIKAVQQDSSSGYYLFQGVTGSSEVFRVDRVGDIYMAGNLVATRTWVQSQGYLTSLPAHNHDDRYYTESESDARFVNVAGDTMTGDLYAPRVLLGSGTDPGYVGSGGLKIGRTDTNYTHGYGWGETSSTMFIDCAKTATITIHDSGHRLVEYMTFEGDGTNIIYSGRDIGWGTTSWFFGADVTVDGTITENSSIRYKENVRPLESVSDKIAKVAPVRYNKKGGSTEEIGFIAEDMATIYPEVVKFDAEGRPDGINYTRLSAILIKAVQELTNKVNELEKKA